MHIIYDFETIGQDLKTACPVAIAWCLFDHNKFISDEPYTFESLEQSVRFEKFDVEHCVREHDYVINRESLDWWSQQSPKMLSQLKKTSNDRTIDEFVSIFYNDLKDVSLKNSWCRGTNYDPIIFEFLLERVKDQNYSKLIKDKLKYWAIRDTRSWIDAKLEGTNLRNDFILDEWKNQFIKHYCPHDIIIDILRMQAITREENDVV